MLWCVGGIEARSTFFPVDDSCPGHGTDCKRGLGELQNIHTHTHTHTLTQITRLFAEEIVSSILKIQKFTQICMHACKHTKPTGFPSLCNPTRQDVPDSPVQYTSTQTHLSLPHISHTKSLKVSDPQSRWVEWLKNTH